MGPFMGQKEMPVKSNRRDIRQSVLVSPKFDLREPPASKDQPLPFSLNENAA